MAKTVREILESHTGEGELYTKLENNAVQCFACAHECRIKPDKEGLCRIRFNRDGKLFVPKGYVNGLAMDPIEKKPFYHVLPGTSALSFGMLGCDFHCSFCQNWVSSQTLRDPEAVSSIQKISAEEIVRMALEQNSPLIVSTYNEPLVTSEWAVEILKLAKPHGIRGAYVSNGHATEKVLDYIRPFVDFYKIDLKTFNPKNYAELGGKLEKVLNGIRMVKEKGFWLEIVTLVVPGFNDSDAELKEIAEFIVSISPDTPWHVTAFHSDYKMLGTQSTPIKTLEKAVAIGKRTGLRFVYAGNLPSGELENTYCPECGHLLIERYGFQVSKNKIKKGMCPSCSASIPGVWE
jgi:pyruvate formate lyase activating enzyme